jgi:hypothetical protein
MLLAYYFSLEIILLSYFTSQGRYLGHHSEKAFNFIEIHAMMKIFTDKIIVFTIIPSLVALFSLFLLYRYLTPTKRTFHAPLLGANENVKGGNISVESFHPVLKDNYGKVSTESTSIEAVYCTRRYIVTDTVSRHLLQGSAAIWRCSYTTNKIR